MKEDKMDKTEYLGMNLPKPSDKVLIEDLTDNFKIIDEHLKDDISISIGEEEPSNSSKIWIEIL